MDTSFQQLLKAITGADAVDLIELKPGQSLEDAIAEHEKTCDVCKANAAAQDVKPPNDPSRKSQRLRALASVRRAQAELLARYDTLRELETSLAKDESERTSQDMFKEIVLFARLATP